MGWAHWRRHFETRARRPRPVVEPPQSPLPHAGPIARSLATFQLGEAGEGRIAHEIDRVCLPSIDADYRRALKLFVAEEGRHAAILARCVLALGGTLLHRDWTERLFVAGRRLLGVRLKIVVLLAAEVLGLTFYRLLAARLPRGGVRTALSQIARDELSHLRFHAEFLSTQSPRLLLRAAVWVICALAALVVVLDHRRTLRALGISATAVLSRMWRLTAAAQSSSRSDGALRAMPSRRLSSRAA